MGLQDQSRGTLGVQTGTLKYQQRQPNGSVAPAQTAPGALPTNFVAATGASQVDPVSGHMGFTKQGNSWVGNKFNTNPAQPAPAAPAAPAPAAPPAAAAPHPTQQPAGPGVLGEDGYLEQLYKQRMSGDDPFYNALRTRGTTALNNQFAARGGFNSSGATNAIGDYLTGVDARQFKDQADLAAAASGERRGRFSDMWDRASGTSAAHLGATAPLGKAVGAIGDADFQAIQLQLDRAGIDPRMKQQILDNMFGSAKAGAQIYGDYKGGQAGSTTNTDPHYFENLYDFGDV